MVYVEAYPLALCKAQAVRLRTMPRLPDGRAVAAAARRIVTNVTSGRARMRKGIPQEPVPGLT
jgi:hypothetical protein